MATNIGRSLIGAVAAAACLALAPTARAALYYQSTFDPPDNFIVNAIFKVDTFAGSTPANDCFDGNSGWVGANAFATGARPCKVTLLSAVATLKSGTDTVYIPFVSYTNPNPNPNIIIGIYDMGDEPGGVAWFPWLIGSQTTTAADTSNPELQGRWWLSFFNSDLTGPPFDSTAYLWKEQCEIVHERQVCAPKLVPGAGGVAEIVNKNDPSGFRFVGNEQPRLGVDGAVLVPEPGSIALVLGALAAGWLTRRRKAAA